MQDNKISIQTGTYSSLNDRSVFSQEAQKLKDQIQQCATTMSQRNCGSQIIQQVPYICQETSSQGPIVITQPRKKETIVEERSDYLIEIEKLKKKNKKLKEDLKNQSKREKVRVEPIQIPQTRPLVEIDTRQISEQFNRIENELRRQKQSAAVPKNQDDKVVEVKVDCDQSVIKKLMQRCQKFEKDYFEVNAKYEEYRWKCEEVSKALGEKDDTIDELQRKLKRSEKLLLESTVESERYKVIAQCLEEELERMRRRPPDLQVVEKPVDKIVEVPVDRIVEKIKEVPVYVDKIVEVPIDRIKEVPVYLDKVIEIPVEKIREVPVYIDKIVEVPSEKIVEKIVEVPVCKEVPVPVSVPMQMQSQINFRERENEFDMMRQEVARYKTYLDEANQEINRWKLRLNDFETNQKLRSDDEIRRLQQINRDFQDQHNRDLQQIDDYRKRIDMLYNELRNITAANMQKNNELESHIQQLEYLLQTSGQTRPQFNQAPQQYY